MVDTLYKNVSSISFPTVVYPNRDIRFNQYVSNLEQGYIVNSVHALSGLRDTKINSYNSFYLSNKDFLTNFITVTSLDVDIRTITTNLKFNLTTPRYFYIYEENCLSASDSVRPLAILTESEGIFPNNYKFELDILNDKLLRIKHNNGLNDYYLVYHWEQQQFFFTLYNSGDVVSEERADTFRYSLDSDGYLQIYGVANNILHVLTLSDNLSTITFTPVVSGSSGFSTKNVINIQYNFNTFDNQLNNSFINYQTLDQNSLKFDIQKSDFKNSPNQLLLHTTYNTISNNEAVLNFANLNTNRTEYGYVRRGSNLFTGGDYIPSHDYRDYKSIYTGVDQERGSDNIVLNYNFYDKDIFVEQDATTVFTTPSSLYPYDLLNINDSTLAQNGAFGAPTPELADKVYIKRDNNDYYTNGRYLCTWLSAGVSDIPGVWVDRYYYPDKITKQAALSGESKYDSSFYDSVDSIDLGVADTTLVNEKFFDKKSDAAFIPNTIVKYERVGVKTIQNIVDTATPLISCLGNFNTARVTSAGDYRTICNDSIDCSFTYDGTKYHKLDVYRSLNAKKEFTISFDAYIDANNQYGYQILGNNTNAGFGLFQDLTVTPFLHVAYKNTLYIYNTSLTLISQIEFDNNIKDVFKRSAMDDYIVTCTDNMIFKVTAQGNKIKLETENLIFGYIGYLMEDSNIYFLLEGGIIYSLDVNTLEVVQVTAKEFPAYKGIYSKNTYTGLVKHNNELYYLPSNNVKYEDNNTVFYTLSNYVIKHELNLNPITFCESSGIVNDVTILDKEVYVATKNKIHTFTTTGLPLSVYNLDATGTLLSGGNILALDVINEYVAGVNRKYVNALCSTSLSSLSIYQDIAGVFSTAPTITELPTLSGIPTRPSSQDVANTGSRSLTKLTNYNRINQLYDSSSLDFKLTLQNYLNSEDKITKTISFTPSSFDIGYHTFTYRYDSIQGNATLYVDGKLYENQTFQPGKYYIQDTYNDELYVGTAGFFNGIDLAEYLKQPTYYYINNLRLKNFYVFDKALSTTQIYALDLVETKINNLVISLPCGQRNNKEEIERFYKFGRYNSSKSVDIVVKNLNTSNQDVLDLVKNNILNESKQILPVGVSINNIKFVNYI